jgi:glycosyltransferase involved in cell wall biosynthesis
MPQPRLAICAPAYNAVRFLPRLLRSVHQQTVPFDEVWVYDDCSTDETAALAAESGARVVRGATNRGCATGRNALAQRTSCNWIHFHDADDALHPQFVERARRWMERNDAPEVVLFGYEERYDESDVKFDERIYDSAALRADPVAYTITNQVQSICGIYQRVPFLAAGGYDDDPDVLFNEDAAMHCRLARAGLRFDVEPAITVINYRRGNSMSAANQYKCARAQYHVMRKGAAELNGRYSDLIARRLWVVAAASAGYLDWQNADACVSLAVSVDGKIPREASLLFKALCAINPHAAIRVREALIRKLKPSFRKNTPVVPKAA